MRICSAVTFSVIAPGRLEAAAQSCDILLDVRLIEGKFFQQAPLVGVAGQLEIFPNVGGTTIDSSNIGRPSDIQTVYASFRLAKRPEKT